jgi:site-specific DNA-methyltransferase (adenine-specific)
MKPYFETDLGVLYHGDCLEIMPQLEPVDLVLADPPWNMGYFENDSKTWDEYCRTLYLWLHCFIHRSDNIIIFQSSKAIPYVSHLFAGWKPFVAVKNFSQMTPKFIPNCFDIAFIRNDKFYRGNGRNWFLCNTAGMLAQRNEHPTPRSLDVITYLLNILRCDSILDPFLGSGTTAVACEQLNRRWIGIEISEKYCEIAAKRIERERQQLKLFQPEPPKPKPEQKSIFKVKP